MPFTHRFLDWTAPALPQAAAFLIERYGGHQPLDLSGCTVALPGGRAGRRLLEILVEQAHARKRPLIPPRIVTVGHLPELLYQRKKPFASPLTQQLAWVEAIHRCPAELTARLFPQSAASADWLGRLALGQLLGQLHRELAAEAQDFSTVASCGARLPGFREQQRWESLACIQREYLRVLDGLDLWDMQTARLYAIQHVECRAPGPIVLVGAVDLNQSQRLMLDQIADQVTVLVAAPVGAVDLFDGHGCLLPEAWQQAVLPLSDQQIDIVDAPADQAAAAIRALAALHGRYPAADVVLGVPDEQVVPFLQQQLEPFEIRARYGAGLPLERTLPYRLLEVIAAHLEAPRFATLATLARHPAIDRWLLSHGVSPEWLVSLDEYQGEHLPADIASVEQITTANLRRAMTSLDQLLARFQGPERPLAEWMPPLLDLTVELLGYRTWNPRVAEERAVIEASRQLHDIAQDYATIPAALMPSVPAGTALQLVLQQLAQGRVPPAADPDAIELLGWLELPLDDAPAAIVTGFNEGVIPSSLNADLFLPNQLRRALGIEDNDRRCARDVYALALLAHSRKELRLIAGRRSLAGDPLVPSRLLFTCDDEQLIVRVRRFFAGPTVAAPPAWTAQLGSPRQPARFDIPRPRPLAQPITTMRVTEFRDYLSCPYRYYLRHVLNLRSLGDAAEELDGAAFGSLAHAVLEAFGRGPAAASTDPALIDAHFSAELDQQVAQIYGAPLPAVRVQVEQLRLRLKALAAWQAQRAADGWQIAHVELQFAAHDVPLVVDGQPMYLRGRIDRIDVHRDGRWAILDYKSADSPKTPEQTHRQHDAWIDLQLPLYRHLVGTLALDGPIELGYVVLPKDVSKTGVLLADWGADELAAADRTAEEVIRQIRQERFWPPASPPPDFSEEFAAICQDGQFGAIPLEPEDES